MIGGSTAVLSATSPVETFKGTAKEMRVGGGTVMVGLGLGLLGVVGVWL